MTARHPETPARCSVVRGKRAAQEANEHASAVSALSRTRCVGCTLGRSHPVQRVSREVPSLGELEHLLRQLVQRVGGPTFRRFAKGPRVEVRENGGVGGVNVIGLAWCLWANMFSTVAVMFFPSPSRFTNTSIEPGRRRPQRFDPVASVGQNSLRSACWRSNTDRRKLSSAPCNRQHAQTLYGAACW